MYAFIVGNQNFQIENIGRVRNNVGIDIYKLSMF